MTSSKPGIRKMPMLARSWRHLAVIGLSLFSLAGCAVNSSTGSMQFVPLMSEAEEARVGAETHPKIVKAYDGVYDNDALGGYVAGVVARIAASSDKHVRYRTTVLDSDVVNAFALPGGYVYVTRGLLALVNDEAELAGVLGHEIGHVDARHSAQRQTAAVGTSLLGAVVGAVVGNDVVSQVLGIGQKGFLASYSRDQEYEADKLGVRTLARSGYDPSAQADFLQSMDAEMKLQARLAGSQPGGGTSWFASHPPTPDRVRAARAEARATGIAPGSGRRNRNVFLSHINGMIYGDSPSQGIVDGNRFVHPKLRFSFSVPKGFRIANSSQAVMVTGPEKTIAKFDGATKPAGQPVASYLSNSWARNVRIGNLRRFKLNGMNAASALARVNNYNARLVVIEYSPTRVYRFLLGTLPQVGGRYDKALQSVVESFHTISKAQAARVKPRRVRVVKVRSGQTVASLAKRMAFSSYREQRFRVLNGLGENQTLRSGERVKIVTR